MRASSVLFVVVGCAGGAKATGAVAAVGRVVAGAAIVMTLAGAAVAVADGASAVVWALFRVVAIATNYRMSASRSGFRFPVCCPRLCCLRWYGELWVH